MTAGGRLATVVVSLLVAGCTAGTDPTTTVAPPAAQPPETTTIAPATTTTTTAVDTELAISWASVDYDFGEQRIRAMATVDDGFAAVGTDGDGTSPRLWSSPDGSRWASIAADLPGFQPGYELADLYAGGAGFLLSGTSNPGDPSAETDLLWLSTDGLAWRVLEPEDLVGPVTTGPYMDRMDEMTPAGVTTSGFLVRAAVGSALDAAAFLADRYPAVVGRWDHFRFGSELSTELADVLIFADEDGKELARLSTADFGATGPFSERFIEGIWSEGLWFSPDGHQWTEVTVGPGGGDPVPMEMAASTNSFYVSRFQPEGTVQTRTWRSADGVNWEDVPFDGATPDSVWDLTGAGAGAIAGVDIPGRVTLWHAADDEGFVPLAEPDAVGFIPWMLSGGGAGLIAAGRFDPPSCSDEPCQILPEMRMTFSAEGMKWSVPTKATEFFGMNSIVRAVVVGESNLLALVEYPLEGEDILDPSLLWIGTPGPRTVEPREPEPELGRLVHLWPAAERSFTVEPEFQIWGFVEPGATVDSVHVNEEAVRWHEQAAFEVTGIRLEPGVNRFEVVFSGPEFEEHTVLEVWYLPAAEERPAVLREVAADSITVDWVAVDEDSEFFATYDDDPGVLETFAVSERVVVLHADCGEGSIPYRYFVDLLNDGYDDERWEWISYEILISDGEVVQLDERCFG